VAEAAGLVGAPGVVPAGRAVQQVGHRQVLRVQVAAPGLARNDQSRGMVKIEAEARSELAEVYFYYIFSQATTIWVFLCVYTLSFFDK
jgi:hypothetical protein